MENAVKLFSQVCVAQSFQVNIGYYTSFCSYFITDSIKTIFLSVGLYKTTPLGTIPYILCGDLSGERSISLKISQNQEFLYELKMGCSLFNTLKIYMQYIDEFMQMQFSIVYLPKTAKET